MLLLALLGLASLANAQFQTASFSGRTIQLANPQAPQGVPNVPVRFVHIADSTRPVPDSLSFFAQTFFSDSSGNVFANVPLIPGMVNNYAITWPTCTSVRGRMMLNFNSNGYRNINLITCRDSRPPAFGFLRGFIRHPLLSLGDTISVDFIGLGNNVTFERTFIGAFRNGEGLVAASRIIPGRYLVRATALSGTASILTLPTYHGDALSWSNAVEVIADTVPGRPDFVINLLSGSDSLLGGQFSIVGSVTGDGQAVQTARGALVHTVPFQYSSTYAILTDGLGQPLRSVAVQPNGTFSFTGLQSSTYQVQLESPVVNSSSAVFRLSANSPVASPSFAANASGVQTVITAIGKNIKTSSLQLAPNPASNQIIITGAKGLASIYNTIGSLVAQTSTALPITISGLERGIYFIRATDAAGASQLIRLVKE